MAATAAIQRAAAARASKGTAAGPEGDATQGTYGTGRNNAFGPRPRIAPGRNGPLYGTTPAERRAGVGVRGNTQA